MDFKEFTETSVSISNAWSLAEFIHGDQKDKLGQPYINHLKRVSNNVNGTSAKLVAILHDIIEDAPPTYDIEKDLRNIFDKDIIEAIKDITHRPNEKYTLYIDRVSKNKLARTVKIADLHDNLDPKRLSQLDIKTQERLKKKYLNALEVLGGGA